MSTRDERRDGMRTTGEMNGRRLAEHLGVAHGTVKRWLHEGMPADREHGTQCVWINPTAAQQWIEARYGRTIAFNRQSFIYFAQREDGAIKIGWSADVMRRIQELRRRTRSAVQLLAAFPGDKPDELRLHERFAAHRLEGEWYRHDDDIPAFLRALREAAA